MSFTRSRSRPSRSPSPGSSAWSEARRMDLRSYIEQTLLRPEATPARVEAHCREAAEHGLFGVCILPRHGPLAKRSLQATQLRLVTVVAFPLGGNATAMKAEEARRAVLDG